MKSANIESKFQRKIITTKKLRNPLYHVNVPQNTQKIKPLSMRSLLKFVENLYLYQIDKFYTGYNI